MPKPGEKSTCRNCHKDIWWIDDDRGRFWRSDDDSGSWCVNEGSHEPRLPEPHPRQAAVIEAVCGLANALMGEKGRGWGQTWTRERIAARILADDGAGRTELDELAALYGGTAAAEAEPTTSAASVGPVAPPPLEPLEAINIVFDGPPDHQAGRFVEVETDEGRSIGVGQWVERADGLWSLRITRDGWPTR